MTDSWQPSSSRTTLGVRVTDEDGRTACFARPFHIGRGEDCEFRTDFHGVSRQHVLVTNEQGIWRFRDLDSTNGVILNGQRVRTAVIEGPLTIQLGTDGPYLLLSLEEVEAAPRPRRGDRRPPPPQPAPPASPPPPAASTDTLDSYKQRYFHGAGDDEEVGDQTLMIRQAFREVQRKQKRRYWWMIAAAALLTLGAVGYALYGYARLGQIERDAAGLFYDMKELDVQIAAVERLLANSGDQRAFAQTQQARDRRRDMQARYERYLAQVRGYDRTLSEQERLIMRVTRLFGECDVAAPPGYVAEVSRYIEQWRSTDKYARAIALAAQKGYTRRIADEFLAQGLPPQFFYLALQESTFDEYASGPPTYKGIAKGMWQFIPETGAKYGLRIGPLQEFARPDPADDRHNWEKATRAAARYIKEIYATDAQASGLLVMASYNWGEDRVVTLLRSMPANPRERNFWQVLEKHRDRLPDQTYGYVFAIVSAAVIGENPRLFGFQFDNPLGFLEQR